MSAAWTPNLIMPGVAKCGTTTLYDILVTHPSIAGGREKEIRFLMDSEETQPRSSDIHQSGVEGWRKCYPETLDESIEWWIDATPQYQYQKTARHFIGQLEEKPLILIIVRRPSDRLYSMYQYAKYHQRTIDFIADFPTFISAIRGEQDERLASQTMLFNAWENTKYDALFDEWAGIVGPSCVHMISLEDLIADQPATLAGIADFLKLDAAAFAPSLANNKSNPSVKTRSRNIRILGSRVAKFLPENRLTRAVKNYVKAKNSSSIDKGEKQENKKLLEEIDAYFSPHNKRAMEKALITRI